jgi:cytochrome c-type biogenesis protein
VQYFISFLEGIITFVSPCLLPMLPIYISYFAGGKEKNTKKVVINALGFILGFTVIFVLLGALAGSFGKFLQDYSVIVNIVTGLIVVFFGLNFLGVLKLNIFKGASLSRKT